MMRPNARSPSITSQESFSAVMITDMVADVNVNPELEDGKKSTKEETNLAYDGHMDGDLKSIPLEDADSTKINGAGISKGVILNAVQFSVNDSKKTFDEKPMQLTANLAVPTLTQSTPEPKGFKDMTLTRKIAFGFSFLPSIFFVLCFAVILPCKIPSQCVREVWTRTFNNTEAMSNLIITDKIMLTAFQEGRNLLLGLEKTNGKSTEIGLPFNPAYLKCGNIFDEKRRECVIMDESGKIYKFNGTHSEFLFGVEFKEGNLPPSPLIVSGCSDKLEDIGIAVSKNIIKFLYGGNKLSDFKVPNCDSVPMKLTSWKTSESSDIIFVCNKDGEDKLVKVPQTKWCIESEYSPEKILVLRNGPLDSLKESIIKPLGDNGLVLWSRNEVFVIQSNGSVLWKTSNFSQSEENRFILHGKFLDDDKHLAFISSNFTSGLQVTLLKPSDGSLVKRLKFEGVEASEVMKIEGNKKDYALLLLRKVEQKQDSMTAALTRISDISSTIVSILSNENLYDNTSKPTIEEIAILDFEENLETVKEIRSTENSTLKSIMTANTEEDGTLNMYVLSTLDNFESKTTEVTNINAANWDKKSSKAKCLAK